MIHSGRNAKASPEYRMPREKPCRNARLVMFLGCAVFAAFIISSSGAEVKHDAVPTGAFPVMASEQYSAEPNRNASGGRMSIWDQLEALFASFLLDR